MKWTSKQRVEAIVREIIRMYGLDKNIATRSITKIFIGSVNSISEDEARQICAKVWDILKVEE